jgi:hypothetical protein
LFFPLSPLPFGEVGHLGRFVLGPAVKYPLWVCVRWVGVVGCPPPATLVVGRSAALLFFPGRFPFGGGGPAPRIHLPDVSFSLTGPELGSAREPGLPGPSFGEGAVVQVADQCRVQRDSPP